MAQTITMYKGEKKIIVMPEQREIMEKHGLTYSPVVAEKEPSNEVDEGGQDKKSTVKTK